MDISQIDVDLMAATLITEAASLPTRAITLDAATNAEVVADLLRKVLDTMAKQEPATTCKSFDELQQSGAKITAVAIPGKLVVTCNGNSDVYLLPDSEPQFLTNVAHKINMGEVVDTTGWKKAF